MSDNPFASGDDPFSSDVNPYQSPMTTTGASGDVGAADPSLGGAAGMLRQTKPWVRFISVMLFFGAGFIAIIGLVFVAFGMGGAMPGPLGPIMGLVYIVMALLYVVPGVFLWKYADRIGVFLREQTPGRLTLALESQKSFWKFMGILMLVVLCVYFFAFLLVLARSAL